MGLEAGMSSANRFDSPVAQFMDNPLTRSWPEPAALDAFFRYCVRRFMDRCLAEPRAWLTQADLSGLLSEILREELPRHGMPAYAAHLDYVPAEQQRLETARLPRVGNPLDIVLVVPGTIQRDLGKYDAALALGAVVRLGFTPFTSIKDDLTRLAAMQDKSHGVLFYLVVMGHQDNQPDIELATQEAAKLNIALLGENYTGLQEPVRQGRLL